MWNNQDGHQGYGGGFPQPGGYDNSGYNPGYAPPGGPPPGGYNQHGGGGYGGGYQQDHGGYGGGGYAPPSEPQPGYGGGGYAPPSEPHPEHGTRSYEPPSGNAHMPPTGQQHYGPHFEGKDHQDHQPFFQYSQCTGKRKALLIGINYIGQDGELRGCINDVENLKEFIIKWFKYHEDDIVTLTDDQSDPGRRPTKENILRGMKWLVRDAQPDDSLFFHFSGHGGSTEDTNGDEIDGTDEVIYPVDFQEAGHIVDDDMHEIMVAPLPAGCRLTAIYDSCHSGTALDLPYVYSTEGKIKEPDLAAEAGQGLLDAVTSYARGDMGSVFSSGMGLFKSMMGSGEAQEAHEHAKKTKTSPADVISWSGCKDVQTSADTTENGEATGAMSHAFVSSWEQQPGQTYQQLLNSVRTILKNNYSQKPQLSSSHPMDVDVIYIM